MKCLVVLALTTGCVTTAVSARFFDRPIVVRSDDRRPIPEPEERAFRAKMYLADTLVFDPVVDRLRGSGHGHAGDVNALDEVPDSTWFTNRIGVREVTPEEAVRAADALGPPVLPLVVVAAKRGGGNPGFICADARGTRYLIKFDTAENPGQQTATAPIVQRLFWTIGYYTPSEFVIHFRRDELTVRALDDHKVDAMLRAATRRPDGRYRATASRILDGIPKGGWKRTGTRWDDPNDRVNHQQRRVLRGLRVFAAWTNHTDMKEDNTLDMYVGEPGKGYLIHYLVDFGEALGGDQSEKDRPEIGFEYAWDWKNQGKAFVAFGLWQRPWELQRRTKWLQIGYFGSTPLDPWIWRERFRYRPFSYADRADMYWGAKIVMRFDRPLIEAIVKTGEIGDPEAERYLVETLLARREAIGRAFLDAVTPLDRITLTGDQLCGVDLARHHRLALPSQLVVDGRPGVPIGDGGRVCTTVPISVGYHVARVTIARPDHTTPPLEVHYVGGDKPHLVGLMR
ncbi:MAG: hypothetical protein ABI867_01445 [Kofleriaceae bacterium]